MWSLGDTILGLGFRAPSVFKTKPLENPALWTFLLGSHSCSLGLCEGCVGKLPQFEKCADRLSDKQHSATERSGAQEFQLQSCFASVRPAREPAQPLHMVLFWVSIICGSPTKGRDFWQLSICFLQKPCLRISEPVYLCDPAARSSKHASLLVHKGDWGALPHSLKHQ